MPFLIFIGAERIYSLGAEGIYFIVSAAHSWAADTRKRPSELGKGLWLPPLGQLRLQTGLGQLRKLQRHLLARLGICGLGKAEDAHRMPRSKPKLLVIK